MADKQVVGTRGGVHRRESLVRGKTYHLVVPGDLVTTYDDLWRRLHMEAALQGLPIYTVAGMMLKSGLDVAQSMW